MLTAVLKSKSSSSGPSTVILNRQSKVAVFSLFLRQSKVAVFSLFLSAVLTLFIAENARSQSAVLSGITRAIDAKHDN